MTGNQCALLLQKAVDKPASPEGCQAALDLVTRLGDPLAVSQIATQIRRNHMTIKEYLSLHCERFLLGELNKVDALPPQEQYDFTVATVWGFECVSPQTLGLMRVMAFMDPDAVAESILSQDTVTAGVISLPDDHLCSYPESGDQYAEILTELLRTSLVSHNSETKTLGWHSQVREVVLAKMTRDEQHVYYQVAIDLLHRVWDYTKDRFNRESFQRKRCDEVILNVHSIIAAYNSVVSESGLLLEKAQQLVKLLQESGW
jgi:hypothetical protein